MQQVWMPSLQSAHSAARALLHLYCHQISLAHSVHHVIRLSACLPVRLTNLATHISHVSQQTLYPYDCYDDQKVLEHVRRARGVKTIMWNMSILGLRNVECFTLGFLDWLDDSAPYRCNEMVATARALKPKPLLLPPMSYDAYATLSPTLTHIYTLLSLHNTYISKDLECIWRKQIDSPGIYSSPFLLGTNSFAFLHTKRSSATY